MSYFPPGLTRADLYAMARPGIEQGDKFAALVSAPGCRPETPELLLSTAPMQSASTAELRAKVLAIRAQGEDVACLIGMAEGFSTDPIAALMSGCPTPHP